MGDAGRERGSAILEMAIIFPVIMVLLMIMLFIGMLFYEQVASQAILDDVASRAAANWATAEYGIEVEVPRNTVYDPLRVYWRLVDFSGRAKERVIEKTALDRLQKACLFQDTFQAGDVRVSTEAYFVYRSIRLTVERTFHLPFGDFLESIGVSPEMRYTLAATGVVQDAPEMIRNVDYAADIMRKLGLDGIYQQLNASLKSFTDFFEKLTL